MRTIFIGGPGRSGTSFVARQLGGHAEICAFADIELKFICEKTGLLDLHHTLSEAYTPNRATVALGQFQRMIDGLINGKFGQPAFRDIAPEAAWRSCFEEFTEILLAHGHPQEIDDGAFFAASRHLLRGIGAIAAAQKPDATGRAPLIFLEKTPHALLSIFFLEAIAPGAVYFHVMRDPRSIAQSLRAMRWGPDRLATCCAWVESYCTAWRRIRDLAHAQGLITLELQIEAIAETPEIWAERITAHAGIAPVPGLLGTADAETLNGWSKDCPAEDRAMLDRALEDCVHLSGYDLATIGRPLARVVEAA